MTGTANVKSRSPALRRSAKTSPVSFAKDLTSRPRAWRVVFVMRNGLRFIMRRVTRSVRLPPSRCPPNGIAATCSRRRTHP